MPDFINNFFANIGPELTKAHVNPWALHGVESPNIMPDIEINCEMVKKFIW